MVLLTSSFLECGPEEHQPNAGQCRVMLVFFVVQITNELRGKHSHLRISFNIVKQVKSSVVVPSSK